MLERVYPLLHCMFGQDMDRSTTAQMLPYPLVYISSFRRGVVLQISHYMLTPQGIRFECSVSNALYHDHGNLLSLISYLLLFCRLRFWTFVQQISSTSITQFCL